LKRGGTAGATRPKGPRPGAAGGGIGVFDSGIGGLTVFKALRQALPASERLIYLGDTARVPYGTKSDETVARYARDGTRFLLHQGVKAIVVACNTMSAVALPKLQEETPCLVVGVIGPGAEAACKATRAQSIGVIGTAATIKSGAYPRAIACHLPRARVESRACPLFVPLAEEGWVDNDVARATARAYLDGLGASGIDTLVLGCTHYPLLTAVIGEVMGPSVTLVDSAQATAAVVRERLDERFLLGSTEGAAVGEDHFFVTDSSERFREVGARFLGRPIDRLELVDIAE
jgi:glutamate racemase